MSISIFFIYYVAALRPTLGLSRGDSLTNLILIIEFRPLLWKILFIVDFFVAP